MKILVFAPHDAALNEYIRLFNNSKIYEPIFFISHKTKYINHLKKNYKIINKSNKKLNNKAINKYFLDFLRNFIDDTHIGVFIQRYILCRF